MRISLSVPLTVTTVIVMLTGCGKSEQALPVGDRFGDQFGGMPYLGDATGELFIDGSLMYTWDGEATVSAIEQTADSVSLVFQADFGDEGEINLKIRGRDQHGNFLLEETGAVLRIIDGAISGSFENAAQTISFSGDADKRYVFANIDVLFNQSTDVFPAGSTLKLAFHTSRDVEVEHPGDGNGCQMRLVPIWSPNGMTMGMVPDCG